MRRRQVRVVGNCQASAVANFYRDHVGGTEAEDVAYVDDLGKSADELRAVVADADLVIVQERDFKHGLTRAELGGGKDVYIFPQILAGFLWPYANEPHVHNVVERPISDGPYPSQMGDSFLNRLIAKGVSPEEGLEQYLAHDIAKAAHLDRMAELYLDRQRERDRATGFEIASTIERCFRREKLFLTAEHPEARLFGVMVAQLFETMGVAAETTRIALGNLHRSPFPPSEAPLHPGVIRHFGLEFAGPSTTYARLDEGRFTFEEHVLRYMRYENNAGLRKALHWVGRVDPAETLAELEAALPQSPGSARGYREKGVALERLGRREAALDAYRRAIEIDPDHADGLLVYAEACRRAGETAQGAAYAARAVALYPNLGAAHVTLAEARLAMGDVEGGLAAAREAVRLRSGRADAYRRLGIALALAGHGEAAESFAREGMRLAPDDPNHRNLVAETLEQQHRRAEAIAVLEEGRQLGCENDQTYSLLGNFWMRWDRLEEAEAAFGRGVELHGHHRGDLRDCLLQVQAMRRERA